MRRFYGSNIIFVIGVAECRGGDSASTHGKLMSLGTIKNRIKLVIIVVLCNLGCDAQVEGVHQVEIKDVRFELILCEGKFSMNLKSVNKKKQTQSCVYTLEKKPYRYFGEYIIRKDTLILTDLKFNNQYRFIVNKDGLIPIYPNYTFLLKQDKPLKIVETNDDFLDNCFKVLNKFDSDDKYRRWWEIDTISTFRPELEYSNNNYSITIKNNFITIKYNKLVIVEGFFELSNNRIYLESVDLQRIFIIFKGTKSYKNLIVSIDPLIAFASFHKKYTEKEWLNVIRTAKEFELGGRGALPNIEKIKE